MKFYEVKEVSVVQSTLVKVVCDICKKDIDWSRFYYKVTTGHYDWGNDSCDSVEDKDICSNECLEKEFHLYLESKDHTRYINVQRDTGYSE